MRQAPRFLIPVLLVASTVVACDCESMLASRRRQGAPTSSEGRQVDEPVAATAPPAAPTTRASTVKVAPVSVQAIEPVRQAPPEVGVEAAAGEPTPEVTRRRPFPTRPGARGFDRLRPVKLPHNVLPAQRIGAERLQEQAAEPHELLDR